MQQSMTLNHKRENRFLKATELLNISTVSGTESDTCSIILLEKTLKIFFEMLDKNFKSLKSKLLHLVLFLID